MASGRLGPRHRRRVVQRLRVDHPLAVEHRAVDVAVGREAVRQHQPVALDAGAAVVQLDVLDAKSPTHRRDPVALAHPGAGGHLAEQAVRRHHRHLGPRLQQLDRSAVRPSYRHLLNRAPDIGGARGYADAAVSRGLNYVIDDILASPEYRQSYGDYGVPGGQAHNLEELTKQLTYAMSQKGPYLIDVIM